MIVAALGMEARASAAAREHWRETHATGDGRARPPRGGSGDPGDSGDRAPHQFRVIDRTEDGTMVLHWDVIRPYVPFAPKRAA